MGYLSSHLDGFDLSPYTLFMRPAVGLASLFSLDPFIFWITRNFSTIESNITHIIQVFYRLKQWLLTTGHLDNDQLTTLYTAALTINGSLKTRLYFHHKQGCFSFEMASFAAWLPDETFLFLVSAQLCSRPLMLMPGASILAFFNILYEQYSSHMHFKLMIYLIWYF